MADPRVAALRDRVRIVEDPELTKLVPRLKPARVTLILRDGRRTSHRCDSPRGDFQRPYERQELVAKFRELAGTVLKPAGVAAVESFVLAFGPENTIPELAALMRRHAR